jgi:triacylglycerol lipase
MRKPDLSPASAPARLLAVLGIAVCGFSCSSGANTPHDAAPDADSDSGDSVPPDADGDADADGDPDVDGDADDDSAPEVLPDPVLFIHGVNPGPDDFALMKQRLVADGWPEERLFAHLFADPRWGCNVDNAATIAGWVDEIQTATGADKIDLVAHSMGSLSSRYFMKNLGGHDRVRTYVTLGGMHHGLASPCLSPAGMQCTWDELCQTREFITALNEEPVTPGPAIWVSFYGEADSTVPNESSFLEGAENESFPGVEHSGADGLLEAEAVYLEVRRVLGYAVP